MGGLRRWPLSSSLGGGHDEGQLPLVVGARALRSPLGQVDGRREHLVCRRLILQRWRASWPVCRRRRVFTGRGRAASALSCGIGLQRACNGADDEQQRASRPVAYGTYSASLSCGLSPKWSPLGGTLSCEHSKSRLGTEYGGRYGELPACPPPPCTSLYYVPTQHRRNARAPHGPLNSLWTSYIPYMPPHALAAVAKRCPSTVGRPSPAGAAPLGPAVSARGRLYLAGRRPCMYSARVPKRNVLKSTSSVWPMNPFPAPLSSPSRHPHLRHRRHHHHHHHHRQQRAALPYLPDNLIHDSEPSTPPSVGST